METCLVVVEDEPGVLEMLKDAFDLNHYRVVSISHPQLLEDLPPGLQPGLFLIDIMLPERTGLEVARQLRQGPFRAVPMIGMSASRMLVEEATKSGVFDEVLRKPFDLQLLLDRVRRHYARSA
ncbi:MAG: response regulator [Chloroflexi bacterium]|nr:response regulator [Chloroflexota bacterium]